LFKHLQYSAETDSWSLQIDQFETIVNRATRGGRSLIFLTPRPLRLQKVLFDIRSSSANHEKIKTCPA